MALQRLRTAFLAGRFRNLYDDWDERLTSGAEAPTAFQRLTARI